MESATDFRGLLFTLPSQIKSGLEISQKIKFSKKPDQIIICGMGGSALAGELLKAVFIEQKLNTPIYLHKDYNLPLTINKNSLIICASYSGNTEETISSYKKARFLKKRVLVMASGGALGKLALKNKTPYINIDLNTLPPRLAVLFMFSALVGAMVNSKILPLKAISRLKSSEKNLKIEDIEKEANDIAEKIGDKTPLIYSSNRLNSLSYFLKISFNENAKIHAFCNVLPECQHNEIQGFSDASLSHKFYAIFLRDENDHQRINKRIEIMTQMIAKKNFDFYVIELKSKNIFDKIVFALIFGGFISLKSAQLKNQDPISTPLIDELKSALKK